MANSKSNMNFSNTAGTYTYDTSTNFPGDYTNANNTSIIVDITNKASISVNNLNLNKSTLNIESGTSFTVRAASNMNTGTINVDGNFTADGLINFNNSIINVSGTFTGTRLSNLNSATVNINGGTVNLEGNLANNTGVIFDFNKNPNGTLIISGPNEEDDMETVIIKNYVYGDTIKINYDNDLSSSAILTTSYNSANHELTIYSNGKSLLTLEDFYQGDNSTTSATTQTINGDVYLVLSCFLPGSIIQTQDGATSVEEVSVGDMVVAFINGTATSRRVTWTGQAHCNVRAHLPDDEAGYPVRILKDAIADGVPFKDMLITSEHCLFFDGKFVPARMLVNGRSIFFDKSITSYDYYHIETEDHSVIMADGVLTESYLDTGNRCALSQKGNVVSISGSRNLTWNDAAAPLGVSREFVEPLSHQIEARATAAGIAQKDAAPELTEDADLHLVTDTGASIRPAREHNGHVIFMIPTGVQSVRIASHASRPSDVIGPFVDDRRYFGVAVGEITMFEASKSHAITAHLTDTELNGWNTLEWEDTRWTSGNGLLPLGDRHPNSIALLTIQIKKTGPYLLSDTISEKSALRA